jgi:hypothetical protein
VLKQLPFARSAMFKAAESASAFKEQGVGDDSNSISPEYDSGQSFEDYEYSAAIQSHFKMPLGIHSPLPSSLACK